MTVELKPLGVTCNLSCKYCYQTALRIKQKNIKYDLKEMLQSAKLAGGQLSIFGGEPLLIPIYDLERIFKIGLSLHGKNSLQTNGLLIGDEHLRMFKQYKVGVGVSIDGPDGLNRFRCNEEATDKIITNIERMRELDIPVSVIVTLHKANSLENLSRFKVWGLWLESIGIPNINVHMLESDFPAAKECQLSEDESKIAFVDLAEWLERFPKLIWQPFRDVEAALRGNKSNALCLWNNCDPLATAAVTGIEADGSISGCGRIAKDGINWSKAKTPGYERYISLYQTDQDKGGCRDCRFFLACGGCCPGEAIDGDWRNKSEYCEMLKALFAFYERKILDQKQVPISLNPRRHIMERQTIRLFGYGKRPADGCNSHGDEHGDHMDANINYHGDVPHADQHGDHTDAPAEN